MQGSGACFDKLTHVWTCYMYWSLTEWLCVIFQSIQSVFGYGKMLMWQILMNESVVYSHCPTFELGCIDIFFSKLEFFPHTPLPNLYLLFLATEQYLRQKPQRPAEYSASIYSRQNQRLWQSSRISHHLSSKLYWIWGLFKLKYPNYEIHLALGSSCFSAYT